MNELLLLKNNKQVNEFIKEMNFGAGTSQLREKLSKSISMEDEKHTKIMGWN